MKFYDKNNSTYFLVLKYSQLSIIGRKEYINIIISLNILNYVKYIDFFFFILKPPEKSSQKKFKSYKLILFNQTKFINIWKK